MKARYHILMTTEVLGDYFNTADLQIVLTANLNQDRLINQFNPAYHFDDSAFAAGEQYVRQQRQLAIAALAERRRKDALQALGRLLHARQDFYAHSNWVKLWVERQGGLLQCRPAEIDICLDPLQEPALRSGKGSILLYLLYRIPLIGPSIKRLYLPADSHEAMNLDHPGRGPLFPFAIAAATKHTKMTFERFVAEVAAADGETAVAYLGGKTNIVRGEDGAWLLNEGQTHHLQNRFTASLRPVRYGPWPSRFLLW